MKQSDNEIRAVETEIKNIENDRHFGNQKNVFEKLILFLNLNWKNDLFLGPISN